MVSSLSSSSSASVSSAKGKEPIGSSAAPYFSYLECLPKDVHNLIVPLLVDPDLSRDILPLISIPYLRPGSDEIVRKCKATEKRLKLFYEVTKTTPASSTIPEECRSNILEILGFLKSCKDSHIYYRTRNCIMERRFRAVDSGASFKYLDGRSGKAFSEAELSGFRVLFDSSRKGLYVQVPLKHHCEFSSDAYSFDFGSFQDVALASRGILFVAKETCLEVYDLSHFKHLGELKDPTAKHLYKLDYQFDRITWNQERKCLVGEKKGVVTELRFNVPDTEAKPKMERHSKLDAKICYFAKMALKIIFVEAPIVAFAYTRSTLKVTLKNDFILMGVENCRGFERIKFIALGVLFSAVALPLFPIIQIPYILVSSAFWTFHSVYELKVEVFGK